MDMDSILRNMEAGNGQTKVASAPDSAGEVEATALAAALEKVAGAPAAAIAPENNPINGLVKMANAIAGTEEDRDIAVSAACGSAFADAAVVKLAAYDAEARVEMAKVAGTIQPQQFVEGTYAGMTAEAVQKIASDTTIGVLQELAAAQEGAQQKQAAEYDTGWDQALQHTYEAVQNEFYKGAAEAQMMVSHIRQNAQQ